MKLSRSKRSGMKLVRSKSRKSSINWSECGECLVAFDAEIIREVLEDAAKGKWIVFDTETYDPENRKEGALRLDVAKIVVSSMRAENQPKSVTFVTNVAHPKGIPYHKLFEYMKPVLEDRRVKKIFHHANYDVNVFANHGISVQNYECTQIMSHAQDPNIPKGLKERAPLVGFFLKKTGKIDFGDLEDLADYAGEDTDATAALYRALNNPLHELYLDDYNRAIYNKLDLPLLPVVVGMERRGIRIDRAYFAGLEKTMVERLKDRTAYLYKRNGGEFNLASPPQLRNFLFKKVGIVPKKYTGTGKESTNVEQLALSQGEDPAVDALLEVRKLTTILTRYVSAEQGIPSFADGDDRIHPTFTHSGPVTGRFASSRPNAQNIPNPGKDQFKVRKGFIPSRGHVLLVSDYSQMELRKMAVLSNDPTMISVYNDPKADIHTLTAQACGITRQAAKIVNFGLLYGMGAAKLAYTLTMEGIYTTAAQAAEYIKRFFGTYGRLLPFRDELFEQHAKQGYVEYTSGRRRTHPILLSKVANGGWVAAAQRELLNNVDQGSCADWVKWSMLRCAQNPDLERLGCRMLFQVHDELGFEVPEKNAEAARDIVKQLMEIPPYHVHRGENIEVPVHFLVEPGVGHNWSEAH